MLSKPLALKRPPSLQQPVLAVPAVMSRVLALVLLLAACWPGAEAKVVIGDDLSDVVDSEEDDEYKNWAPKSRYDDPTKKAAAFAMIKLQYKPDRSIVSSSPHWPGFMWMRVLIPCLAAFNSHG